MFRHYKPPAPSPTSIIHKNGLDDGYNSCIKIKPKYFYLIVCKKKNKHINEKKNTKKNEKLLKPVTKKCMSKTT